MEQTIVSYNTKDTKKCRKRKTELESEDENMNKVLHNDRINDLLLVFELCVVDFKTRFLNKRLIPEMRFDL